MGWNNHYNCCRYYCRRHRCRRRCRRCRHNYLQLVPAGAVLGDVPAAAAAAVAAHAASAHAAPIDRGRAEASGGEVGQEA